MSSPLNRVFSPEAAVIYRLTTGVCPVFSLYLLYTNDCKRKYNDRHLLKLADDTVLISLLQEEEVAHGPAWEDFVLKTEVMPIDFSKKKLSPLPSQPSLRADMWR